jgi:competence protein ComEA
MFNQINNQIKKYFGFSNSESKGFIVLVILLLLFAALPFLLDLIPNSKNTTEASDQLKLDSLKAKILSKIEKVKADDPKYSEKEYEHNYDQFANEKSDYKPRTLFRFDPNTLPASGFESLGLPNFLAERIIKYRNAGGKFKSTEDLKKIYGLRPETYSKLAPYVNIASTASTPNDYSTQANNTSEVYPKPIESTKPINPFAKHPVAFDFNKADTTTLMNIKGIGSKLSMRIIKFRDNLGGFYAENQIREVFGLDSTVVLEMLKYGSVKSPIYNKIDINNATEMRHPYLKPYIAKAIIAYREQHGKFNNVTNLKNIKLLDEATIEKIKPYLKFN